MRPLLALALLLAHALPRTQPLPLPDNHQQTTTATSCHDPLHLVLPDSRCPLSRRPVYMMSDGCPAMSVCLSDAVLAKCLQEISQACPADTPVSLLEYSPPEFTCPRQRCVSLGCFTGFCRARRPAGRDSRPLLTAVVPATSCEYLQCGCPASEADLLAQGCPSPDELLVLTADLRSSCPMKLCTQRLPDSMKPLFPTTSTESWTSSTMSITPRPTECPIRVGCPQNTSELTVPSTETGGCPMHICLRPQLIGPGGANGNVTTQEVANTTTSLTTSSTSTVATETTVAATSSMPSSSVTTQQVTDLANSTVVELATTAVPVSTEFTTSAGASTVPVELMNGNSTGVAGTTVTSEAPGTLPAA